MSFNKIFKAMKEQYKAKQTTTNEQIYSNPPAIFLNKAAFKLGLVSNEENPVAYVDLNSIEITKCGVNMNIHYSNTTPP